MIGSGRREAIMAEVEKCDPVCANCDVHFRTVGRARRTITEETVEYHFEIAV